MEDRIICTVVIVPSSAFLILTKQAMFRPFHLFSLTLELYMGSAKCIFGWETTGEMGAKTVFLLFFGSTKALSSLSSRVRPEGYGTSGGDQKSGQTSLEIKLHSSLLLSFFSLLNKNIGAALSSPVSGDFRFPRFCSSKKYE